MRRPESARTGGGRAADRGGSYIELWLDIVNKRGNLPNRLAQAIPQIDMTKWPAPGDPPLPRPFDAGAVLAAADDPNTNTKNE